MICYTLQKLTKPVFHLDSVKILTTPPSNLLGQGRFQQINPFKMTRGRVKTKYFLQNESNSNRCNKVDKYKCQLNVLSLQKLELWVESSLRSNQTQAWYYELRWIHRSFQKLAKLARIMDHYTMIYHIQIDSQSQTNGLSYTTKTKFNWLSKIYLKFSFLFKPDSDTFISSGMFQIKDVQSSTLTNETAWFWGMDQSKAFVSGRCDDPIFNFQTCQTLTEGNFCGKLKK